MKKLCKYTHHGKFSLKKEMLPFAIIWMSLEDIVLYDLLCILDNSTEREILCPLIACGIFKNQMHRNKEQMVTKGKVKEEMG